MDFLLVCFVFASCVALFINWIVFVRWKTINKILSIEDLLLFLSRTKPFPICAEEGWFFHSFEHGHRVWKMILSSPHSDVKHTVFASCCKIETPAQVAARTILDTDKSREWEKGLVKINRLVDPLESNDAPESSLGFKTQWDVVSEVREDVLLWKNILATVVKYTSGIQLHSFSSNIYHRYWQREENGCCWVAKIDVQRFCWSFYLLQPLDGLFEPDHCIVTVLTSSNKQYLQPSLFLSSFTEFLVMNRETCAQFSTFTLPKKRLPLQIFPLSKPLINTEESQRGVIQCIMSFLAQGRVEKRERDIKAAAAIFRANKNLRIDVNANGMMDGVKFDKSNFRFEKHKTSTPTASKSTSPAPTPVKQEKRFMQRSLSASASMMSISPKQSDANQLKKSFSMELDDARVEKMTNMSLNTGEVQYKTICNHCAAELQAEIINISNMVLSSCVDEQAKVTSGWIFVGVEKDVVIMKKILPIDSPQHSYIGKGLIKTSPKIVWDTLRNPRTRFTYDDSLKKVEILHNFQNGMKIVYFYNEVSQLFKRECRDFCVVQGERIERDQSVLTIQSVEWVGCPQAEDAIRGKFLTSGWIVEPVIKEKHIYSMVTYISQINLGSGAVGTLVEEVASKQPLSVAALREYLVPEPTFAKLRKIKEGEMSDTERSNDTSCTTSEF